MSYVLKGELGHYDTLGTKSRVKEGGAQIMQTGSGVSHEEETVGDGTEFFQIWFEPNLQEALLRDPTYAELHDEQFPTDSDHGVTIKSVLGGDAPVSLVADAMMHDVTIEPGSRYERPIRGGRSLAAVTVSGCGAWRRGGDDTPFAIAPKDFAVISADSDTTVIASASEDGGGGGGGGDSLRVVIIEVPTEVDYPLYAKG